MKKYKLGIGIILIGGFFSNQAIANTNTLQLDSKELENESNIISNIKVDKDKENINSYFQELKKNAPEKYRLMLEEKNESTLRSVSSSSKLGTAGDILVTYDNKTSSYKHGHAAIVRLNSNYIVEAMGEKVKFSPNKWKSDYGTYNQLQVRRADGQDYSSSRIYAEAQYGEPYSIAALKNQSSKWYCSLLVYKAWQSRGFNLDADGGTHVTPHDLVQDNDVYVVGSRK
ncbi:distant relative of cell wall-associated hydrolase-like protein [Macrococcus equi]|uniref:distant relative of cell wall-associated hydrolase-like protein n=1 Tax=Macrococcus equi TaxID=3395462 RepID=UPI0039BE71C5